MKSVPYDPLTQFAPIGRIGSFVFMLTINSSVPVKSVPELIAYSKANPGKLSYAVANSVGLAVLEILKHSAGFDVTAVPYRSMPQAVTDLIPGRVSILVVDRGPILPHLEFRRSARADGHHIRAKPPATGRVLVARGRQRHRHQLLGRAVRAAGTSSDIINRVSAELRKVVEDPAVRDGYRRWA